MMTTPRARTSYMFGAGPPLAWLVALGLGLRFFHYGRNPALWHDEAVTVINVIRKSFGELLGPLYASATGPPGFLWLQKCVTLAFGDGTYSLRLVSVLASCAGLIVLAQSARRMLAPAGAFAAVLLVACSDRLLWHAAEARHYSSDFFFGAILLALLFGTSGWPSGRRAFLFAALAPIIIFSSYPGVFLCGGVFIVLWPTLQREKRWVAAAVLGLAIVLAFAAFYFITIRVQRSAAMDAAWVHSFPNWRRPWTVPFWMVRSTVGVFDYVARPIGGILIAAALLGGVRFWRAERRELVFFTLGSLLLAVIAALVKSYPYAGARTMVFAMPALVVMIGNGVDGLLVWRPRIRVARIMALLLVVAPLAATSGLALYRVAVPWPRADTAAASAYVLKHRQLDESVTANHWEYEYYFRGLGGEFVPEMRLLAVPVRPPRVWIVVTAGDLRARDALISAQADRWRVLERREFSGTSVVVAAPRP